MQSVTHAPTLERLDSVRLPEVLDLLARCGLPPDGLAGHVADVVVAVHDERIVGSAGMERYGAAALLRSVAVDAAWRGQGLGDRLVAAVLSQAKTRGVADVYLLTETAADYFARRGFVSITREAVPPAVAGSIEFTHACPASAQAMCLKLAD